MGQEGLGSPLAVWINKQKIMIRVDSESQNCLSSPYAPKENQEALYAFGDGDGHDGSFSNNNGEQGQTK